MMTLCKPGRFVLELDKKQVRGWFPLESITWLYVAFIDLSEQADSTSTKTYTLLDFTINDFTTRNYTSYYIIPFEI